jgi:putative transposase
LVLRGLIRNNSPHSALPKIVDETGKRRHRSPNEEYAHRVNQGWDYTSAHVEQGLLDHLFMPHERIKINRCEFRLHGNLYHSYALQTRHGEDMIAAYDVHDANQVYVLDLDERLICTAKWNGNTIHGVPTTKIEQAEYERIEGQKRLKQRQIDLIESSRSTAPVMQHSAEIQQARLELIREAEEAQLAETFELPPDSRGKWKLWKQLDAQLSAGNELTAQQSGFHKGWQRSEDWRAFNATEQELKAAQK